MLFDFTTIAAVLLLLAPARSAPAGPTLPDACAAVQNSSLELNRLAKEGSLRTGKGSKDVTRFSSPLVWMEAEDQCDPDSLKQDSVPCIVKILAVLKSYRSEIKTVRAFPDCSFDSQVEEALQTLLTDMKKCVQSKTRMSHEESDISSQKKETKAIEEWQKPLLCQYTLDRLFSFSIFTARVFGRGDPAHHADSSAGQCL